VAVEATKDQGKLKLFKEAMTGGSNKLLGDIMIVGTDISLPKYDQPIIVTCTSKKPE